MYLIRPIRVEDLERFLELCSQCTIGLTNLPKDPPVIQQKIDISNIAFQNKSEKLRTTYYTFVLEDTDTGEIGGTSGILAGCKKEPIHFFLVDSEKAPKSTLPIKKEQLLLKPVSYYDSPTEIVSLFLSKNFRKEGLGRTLSLSRFLFIASNRSRFDDIIFAEMRGYIDENRNCPFWDAIGRKFIDLDYQHLAELLTYRRDFIPDIMPKHPIYLSLLPKEVQNVIGKTHAHTTPALAMLAQEGFEWTREVDLFDGGPKIEVPTGDIRTIKDSKTATISNVKKEIDNDTSYLVSNNRLDFRACSTEIDVHDGDELTVCITEETARHLELEIGDTIRYVPLWPVNNKRTEM